MFALRYEPAGSQVWLLARGLVKLARGFASNVTRTMKDPTNNSKLANSFSFLFRKISFLEKVFAQDKKYLLNK